jgi:hypothetical protein
MEHVDSPSDIDSTASERIVVESRGLESGALGMFASVAVGVASTAPAYSLAATLGFVVAVIGLQTPLLVVLAFIPMFLTAARAHRRAMTVRVFSGLWPYGARQNGLCAGHCLEGAPVLTCQASKR